MNKYHICFFIPSLNVGGAEKMMVLLANHYSSNPSYTVSFILLREGGALESKLSEKVNLIVLKKSRVLLSIFALSKVLKKTNPDVVLSALGHSNVAAVIAKIISGVKSRVVISERSTVSHSPAFSNGLKGTLNKVFYKFFYLKSDRIIAISQGVKKDLVDFLKLPEKDIEVIYNPAYPESLSLYNKIDRNDFGIPKNKKFIVSTGRLEPAKDFLTLLKALKILQKENVFLVVLGEGSRREELENYIIDNNLTDKILLPGYVQEPCEWLLASDLYVCSSAWEGFGNAIVEAMACGLPVVATDCAGPREILGGLTQLVPVGDEALMAKAILSALQVKDAEPYIQKAKEFSMDKISAKYLKVLTQ